MLTQAHRQEAMSRAYIHAIAARCGYSCSFRELDYGMDLTIHDITNRRDRLVESGHNLDVQAKSTGLAQVTATHLVYDLDVRGYNDLREPDVGVPRVLVLLLLPADEEAWTDQNEDRLELRLCAYWLSLRGMAPTSNTRTIRVAVPRTHVFSIQALRDLMDKVRRKEQL